ncbi:MlaD family protein [Patulibacter defluvii]|uniref:MlaD family protein n=1 Tax=Patulibacter defluvii TaxID=3095358 RepID=UPI002A760A68|nr:MlaD family protein [Patulibacter sp. DM4]
MRLPPRLVLPAFLVLAALAVVAIVRGGENDYRIAFRVADAGQLIPGNDVTVAGQRVGAVTAVGLAPDRRARIELRIDDDRWRPLRRGTRAAITPGGLAGQSNRVVALEPGPRDGPRIADGGELAAADVRGIVDLDHVLTALDARTRGRLARLLRRADANLAGTGPDGARTLDAAGPAVTAAGDLLSDVAAEEPAIDRLLRSADALTGTIAAHEQDLRVGLRSTRRVVGTVAEHRAELTRTLERSPALVRDATATLRRARPTLVRLQPTIDAAAPLVGPLTVLARRLDASGPRLLAALADGADLVDRAGPLLDRLPGLLPQIETGLRDVRSTLRTLVPAMDQIRPYVPDVLGGFTAGFAGTAGGYYDANGNYGRASVNLGAGLFDGILPNLLPNLLGQKGIRTGLTNRCPGSAAAPAADRSNPWVPAGVHCDREDDER